MTGQADRIDQLFARSAKVLIGTRKKLDMQEKNNTEWQRLRSDIYIRDKGMCWICNTFVPLHEYDLGHIIDRSNGGHDDYDNLAVMHRPCNHSKPYHQTLEEAVKWKLTAFMPAIQQARGISNKPSKHQPPTFKSTLQRGYSYNHYHFGDFRKPMGIHRKNHTRLAKQDIFKKIPSDAVFITWIQGRPEGGAMWKLLLPPYEQDTLFTTHSMPPGAIDNGLNKPHETIQIIGGILVDDIYVSLGYQNILISQNQSGGRPSITFKQGSKANVDARSKTVGMGIGQIPLDNWYKAKAQGISFSDFRGKFTLAHISNSQS